MNTDDSFPITLAFPPQGHFTQPYLALPCLKAWLHQGGHRDVELRDISVEAYEHFLSPDYLDYARHRAAASLETERLENPAEGELDFENMRAWRAAVETEVSADALIDTIDDAKKVMRGPDCFDPEKYVPAARALYHGLRVVSAAHSPSELTPHNFTMRYANDRSEEVLAATLDEKENPFIKFYAEHVLPGLIERKPRVLGLSIIYGSQLIPALTLGRMVKEALPDCHVTAGGGFLAYIGRKLTQAPNMDSCLDSIIFHEGEGPLLALCDALKASKPGEIVDLTEIGGMTWFDRRGELKVTDNGLTHPVKLDEAPVPDFRGLPFDLYFSPEIVIPYDINRGCYYGECAFCTLPTVIGPGYRTRKADTIAKHVTDLRDHYKTTHFNFITDCMPPGMIRDLPEALIESQANITWWSDARVEPKAYDEKGAKRLYDSGCRKLLFGYETATPRLLKMMKKGQSLKATAKVAENCNNAGISVTWYTMVGFPSETREEARATLAFIQANSPAVREVSLQTFHIDEVAETYHRPEQFGIKILNDDTADLQLYHDYEASTGMTQQEAAEMFEEMMAGLRESLPLFGGDNIFYFMQKSHYFLQLAAGSTPDQFIERCAQRKTKRAAREAHPNLVPAPGLRLRDLPFAYTQVIETLSHPLARAARPDFLTGRFVSDAEEQARQALSGAPRTRSVLAYDGENHEFLELSPDARKLIGALDQAGSLGALLDTLNPDAPETGRTREKLNAFSRELHRNGLLAVKNSSNPKVTLNPQSTPSHA